MLARVRVWYFTAGAEVVNLHRLMQGMRVTGYEGILSIATEESKPPASSGLNDCACPVRQWHALPVSSFAAKGYVSSMKKQEVAIAQVDKKTKRSRSHRC